jgi:hypothetical protein
MFVSNILSTNNYFYFGDEYYQRWEFNYLKLLEVFLFGNGRWNLKLLLFFIGENEQF